MKSDNKTKLRVGVRIIDMLIGAAISLICFTLLTFIDNLYVRYGLIAWVIRVGVTGYLIYVLKEERRKERIEEAGISKIVLINEDNKPIKEWNLLGEVSVVIGKSTKDEEVYIDLNDSIYSPLIDDNHAVLNYASGNWYVEDISLDKGVAIRKAEDNEKYNIVKGSPCTLKKGDIIYISKVKLQLA